MKLPIRNYMSAPLTLFIEPWCDQYEIPAGGEAIVTLEDGRPHSIDVHSEQWVALWDEGAGCTIEVFATHRSLQK